MPSIDNCIDYLKKMYAVFRKSLTPSVDYEFFKLLLNTCNDLMYENIFDYLHFLEEAFVYFDLCDYFDGMREIEKIYSKTVKAKAPKEKMYLAKLYWIQSACFCFVDNNYQKAIPLAEKALDLANSCGLEFKANCLHNIGQIHHHVGHYEKCRTYLLSALDIYSQIGIYDHNTEQTEQLLRHANVEIMSKKK